VSSEEAAQRAIEAGSSIVGGVTGAALGAALGGPPGAAVGSAAGASVEAALREVASRWLSDREQVRVGAAAIYARQVIETRLNGGEEPRDDGWFDRQPRGRSAADELLEGTLLIARRQHQERKVQYVGRLMGNLCFEPDIDEFVGDWLLRQADELSWTQYVLLAAIGLPSVTLPSTDMRAGIKDWASWGMHEQLADLGYARRELVGAPARTTERLGLSVPNTTMSDLTLGSGGRLLFELMSLADVPPTDINDALYRLEAKEQ
jgi:hypothetical protein